MTSLPLFTRSVTVRIPAGTHNLWSDEAADSMVGTKTKLALADEKVGCLIDNAWVEDEGRFLCVRLVSPEGES